METNNKPGCYHCGEDCGAAPIHFDQKQFCCQGCRTVYEILRKNDACDYYKFESHPGTKALQTELGGKYAFLENEEIKSELLDFQDGGMARIRLFIPSIHCSSCIWLLENLDRFSDGIRQSTVQFVKREVSVLFDERIISLRQVVELLVSLNYIPQFAAGSKKMGRGRKTNRALLYRLGVAGFCFGNMMLFSFPAYLAVNDAVEEILRRNFGLLNILFGIPVAFYSGSGYLTSAWKGLKKRFVSIDVPISIGILVLFFRSVYEIWTGLGPGYMDSLGGLLFFLLVGKWYQDKTYQAMDFDRNFESYFPVGVTVLGEDGGEKIVPLRKIKPGMRILVRHQELIPADSLLVEGEGQIDYSFVSGESNPVPKKTGDRVFAGGRQVGGLLELLVEKEVEQSRLTELWNQDLGDSGKASRLDHYITRASQRLTAAILLIALGGGIAWWFIDSREAFQVVTSVLIVACPCALALSAPFTFGGVMRIMGQNGFYLKKTSVVESLAGVDSIIFDKTGTLTRSDAWHIGFGSLEGNLEGLTLLKSLVRYSTHPLSVAIYQHIKDLPVFPVTGFEEIPGKGMQGTVNGVAVKVGSWSFVEPGAFPDTDANPFVSVAFNGRPMGRITYKNLYREGLDVVIPSLRQHYALSLLSGDHDSEKPFLLPLFGDQAVMKFRQTPQDKLDFVRDLRAKGKKVLMIGDGLNDAGALSASHCGISVADDVYHFSPACDAILASGQFAQIHHLIRFSKNALRVVKASLVLSLLYNSIGLGFALAGKLTPVVSAILMPLSSVSVVVFVSLSVSLLARKAGFRWKLN